jgi:hypothetical protein
MRVSVGPHKDNSEHTRTLLPSGFAHRLFVFLSTQELQSALPNTMRHVNDAAVKQARSLYTLNPIFATRKYLSVKHQSGAFNAEAKSERDLGRGTREDFQNSYIGLIHDIEPRTLK